MILKEEGSEGDTWVQSSHGIRKRVLIESEWKKEREWQEVRNHFPELRVSDAVREAERQTDGVGSTGKERATPRKRGDCKRPLHNEEGAVHANQNINGNIWDWTL